MALSCIAKAKLPADHNKRIEEQVLRDLIEWFGDHDDLYDFAAEVVVDDIREFAKDRLLGPL